MANIVGMIKCVDIMESYNENITDNIKYVNIDELINRLTKDIDKYQENKFSLFEIISNKCSPYFDIENIPTDKSDLIILIKNNIIKTFEKYSNIKINKKQRRNGLNKQQLINSWIITENISSTSHDGLSYHLIFPNMITTQNKLKQFTFIFLRDYPEFIPYVDQSVYSKNRLFRYPYQSGINPPTQTRGRDNDSVHVIKYAHLLNSLSSYWSSYIEYTGNKQIKDKNVLNKLLTSVIISDYTHKETKEISYKYDAESLIYIRSQTPKTISQTTAYIKDEHIKQIYQRNKPNKQITDIDIYNKCIILNELTTNGLYKNKINEFITYYNENNNSFVNFRLTSEQIHGILSIIESKC